MLKKPVVVKVEVRMLKSTPGSENGIHTRLFVEGKTYSIVKELADSFVKSGKAVKVIDAKMSSGYDNKMKGGADYNGKEQKQKEEGRRQEADSQEKGKEVKVKGHRN